MVLWGDWELMTINDIHQCATCKRNCGNPPIPGTSVASASHLLVGSQLVHRLLLYSILYTYNHTIHYNAAINVTPHPPLYGDRWGIGGDLTHRMCQIPHPSITIQCQIPTLYIHTRICAGTRANASAGQKPHPWGVISWRIPYQAPPLSPTGGGGA